MSYTRTPGTCSRLISGLHLPEIGCEAVNGERTSFWQNSRCCRSMWCRDCSEYVSNAVWECQVYYDAILGKLPTSLIRWSSWMPTATQGTYRISSN